MVSPAPVPIAALCRLPCPPSSAGKAALAARRELSALSIAE